MAESNYYLCALVNPERGSTPEERETTIVQGTDKTDAGFRAMRKVVKAIGAKRGKQYTLWSVTRIKTTF